VNKNVPFSESDALERAISPYADISKAKALLGYESQTPIKLGIKKYVEWLKMT
jgi:nucleoside-diphosphate-sugar epimerase